MPSRRGGRATATARIAWRAIEIQGHAQSVKTSIRVAPYRLTRRRPFISGVLGKMKQTARGIGWLAIRASRSTCNVGNERHTDHHGHGKDAESADDGSHPCRSVR